MPPSSTATIALKLDSDDFATKANNASTALLGVQLAAGGAGLAFKGLGAVARTSLAEVTIGAVAVDKLNTNLGKLATNSGKLSGIAGNLSTFAYNTALATTAISGLVDASAALNRIPKTIASINASGISTQTIAEFEQFKEAFLGKQEAVEGFVNVAIARLGEFEQAAARSATILKSSTRFDESGNAMRVNGAESLANAMSIQALVTNKLDNAVTSQAAILAQYEVLSGGFANQQDSEKVLETALKLTQIGQAGGVASNAGDNAKLLTKSLQAYSLGGNEAARTGAILNAIVENGITTIPELSSGFGAAGSSAAKAGISISALGAGVAQLTSLGQDTSEALTGLKGLSDAIINKTPEAAAELAKLSLNGQRIRFDTAEVQAKGLVQALLDVNKAAGNSPQILAKIFPDAVTSRAVTGLISGGGAGFKARFDAIDGASAASLDEVAFNASNTRINKMQKLANKFGEIVISIAQSVAPVIEPGLDFLKKVADGFAAIPEPVKAALGSWITFQVQAQATSAAIGIIAKTLGDLAGIYAIGRVISLAMTGQLGAELTVIKQLIVQRKGLASVVLQTIGINQRHRLSVDAATAALTNQGIVAKGVYAAQARGADLLASAGNRARDIVARNVAGARAAAAEFGRTPAAGQAVNAAVGIRARVEGAASQVANSQTGQNVRNAVGGFLERNPAIGTATTELKGVATSAIGKIKEVAGAAITGAGKATAAVRATVADPYSIPDPWADAPTKIGNALAEPLGTRIGEGINKGTQVASNLTMQAKNLLEEKALIARSKATASAARLAANGQVTDINKVDPIRLGQITDAELQLKSPKSLALNNKTNTELATTQAELAAREKTYETRFKELERKRNNFVDRAQRLEEIKDKLSPESYQKSIAKLNKDAEKLTQLESTVQSSRKNLLESRQKAYLLAENATLSNRALDGKIDLANAKFAPVVAAESKLAKLQELAEKSKEKASLLTDYANNLGKIDPNSAEAIAAKERATRETSRSTRIADRANSVREQYQGLMDSTGARTALLSQQGLAQVRYGNSTATYSTNSRLESLLYADVGKSIKGAFESATKFIGGLSLSGTFVYLRSTAQAAAAALGRIGSVGLVQSIREGLAALPARLQNFGGTALAGARAAYAQGGVLGVGRAGFGAAITGADSLGQRLLPFLPTAIAGAVVAPATVAAIGAVVLRDDLKRSQLAGEFRSSVDATLKKDNELRAKYEDRSRPLAELRAAVAQIAEGKDFKFSSTPGKTTTATAAGGILENTIGLPGKAIGGVGAAANAVGSALNNTVAPQFNLEGASTLKAIDPVREQLKLLANSGQLTTDQFKDLDSTLSKMGASGKIGAAELDKFNAKLNEIKNQDKPKARGVVDSIGDFFYNIPGALGNATGNTVDYIANSFGAGLSGKSIEETAKNREADALISYLGDGTNEGSLTSLTNATLDASVDTRRNLVAYRQGTAIDETNAEKIAAGKELTTADLEREKLQTTNRIERNNALVADYDTKLKDLQEQLAKQKDPENQTLLKNAIGAYTQQKDALLKNTEGLKAAEAAFSKYNAETLPNLVRALKETQDPTKAVGLAAEDFNQIYQKDASGELTKYVKDIAVLRAEAGKYVESIVTKYGTDNSAAAEREAIEQLKTARDNRITVSTGDSGFRDTIATRMGLTDQIVKIQQAESQRIIADRTLTGEKLKVLTSNGAIAEQEARIKSQDLGIEIAQTNLAAKQKEIEEYAQFPRKVVELEQQAATMRVQLEQQVADKQKAIRERDFALRQAQFDIQSEYLKTELAELRVGGVSAIEQAANAELDKARSSIEKLYEDRKRLTESSPELDNQITKGEQQYQQQRASFITQIFDARQQLAKQLIGLDATRQIQPLSVKNKQIGSYQKVEELRSNILSTNRELLNTSLNIQQSQLSNEGKLANSAVVRANIELTSAKAKLANLGAVQSYERQSLILQQELTELSFKSQQNQLNISRIEQQRTIKELELQKLKLDRDKSNSPESKAAKEELEYQIAAAKIQLTGLDTQATVLAKQAETNKQITNAKLQQNTATVANAKETERINVLLADINVKTAKITESTERQNLIYTAQTNKLTAVANTIDLTNKQLENRSKILTTQQGLIGAIADSRVGELGLMTNLTSIESVKLNLAQQQATIKLASLTAQIGYEKDILELNIQQQKATYEQDKLKQQISEKNAERDIINSQAAYEKLLAKGKLADPRELEAARIDLSSKFDSQALVRGNREILAQQGQFIDYSARVQRIQLDMTQKGKLQSALAERGATLPETERANFENTFFNAGARQEGTQYYKEWADAVVKEANLNPIVLPQFNSPYDPRSNYNRPGVADPTKLAPSNEVNYRSGVGSLEFTPPPAPVLQPVDMSRFQRDAAARYAEFVRQPIKIEISPAVRESQQEGRRKEADGRRSEEPVKPIVIQGLQVTNDMKISIANSTEGKDAIENNFLSSFEGVVRLIKEKY